MSYPIFKEFDKSTTDLINDDFDNKFSLKVKSPVCSSTPCVATVTTTTTYCPKENKLIPKLGLKWSHNSGFTLEKLEVAQDAKLNVETSLNGVASGLKLEFKGNDTDKADLSFNYSIPAATFTGEVDIHNLSGAKATVNAGHGAFTFGGCADVKIAKSAVESTSFGLGVGYTAPKLFVGARACKNFSNYSANFTYEATREVTLAGKVNNNTKETSAALVTVYKCCPNTTIKAKVDTNGVFAASVKQSLDKKFSVIGSAEVPSSFNTVKFGINATIG